MTQLKSRLRTVCVWKASTHTQSLLCKACSPHHFSPCGKANLRNGDHVRAKSRRKALSYWFPFLLREKAFDHNLLQLPTSTISRKQSRCIDARLFSLKIRILKKTPLLRYRGNEETVSGTWVALFLASRHAIRRGSLRRRSSAFSCFSNETEVSKK